MTTIELLIMIIYAGVALMTVYGYGHIVFCLGTSFIKQKVGDRHDNNGIKILIGLGTYGNLALVAGLAGLFDKKYLSLLAAAGIIVTLRLIWESRTSWYKNIKWALAQLKLDWNSIPVILATLAVLGVLFLAALRPPHATDELHYHFPQARAVAESGRIDHSWDGHYFYGNIPKLGDIMFAIGLEMQGYQLAHVLNYMFLVGFVIFVFETLSHWYGIRTGSFAALFLVLFSDYTWNATVGFVDAATSSLEIAALIVTGLWLKTSKQYYLLTAGMLLGLALGSKYSPLPTALFLTIVISYVSLRKRKLVPNLLTFGGSAVVMGGYWYIKNWILFGNPFYPMYFGHRGVSEDSYRGLMDAIWQWEPKTLPVFLEKLKRWLTYTDATTYLSIWLAPLVLIWHRTDAMIKLLLSFYMLYIPYWFFLATHQTRFLLSALLISNLLLAIILSKMPTKILILGTAVLIISGLIIRPYPERNLLEHYLWIKLHVVERQFALGNLSEKEFLEREFGCYYSTVDYLNRNNLTGDVIDNWSQYKAPSVRYFAINRFLSVKDYEKILRGNYGFYYYDESVKDIHLADQDPYFVSLSEYYIPIHTYIQSNWRQIYNSGDCHLFLNPDKT